MNNVLLILILLVGGMLLILAEICTPAFGVLAVAAIACFVVVIYQCFLVSPVLGFIGALALLIGLPVYTYYLMRIFPKTPMGKRLMLRAIKADTGGAVPEAAEYEKLIGAEGVATSVLRPSGTVSINGRRMVATAESGFIEEQTPIRVTKSSAMNIVVRAISQAAGNDE